MSRTFKDKSFKYGGKKYWKASERKLVKEEIHNHRHFLNRLTTRPPLGYLHKFLSDLWHWI